MSSYEVVPHAIPYPMPLRCLSSTTVLVSPHAI